MILIEKGDPRFSELDELFNENSEEVKDTMPKGIKVQVKKQNIVIEETNAEIPHGKTKKEKKRRYPRHKK